MSIGIFIKKLFISPKKNESKSRKPNCYEDYYEDYSSTRGCKKCDWIGSCKFYTVNPFNK